VKETIDAGTGVSNNAARTSASKSQHDASVEAFVQACGKGDMAFVRQWKRRGYKMLSSRPLLQAAGYGQLKVLRFLVKERGADVNRIDSEGFTALYVAAREGKLYDSWLKILPRMSTKQVNTVKRRCILRQNSVT
jgi:hypothetical protein